jgi:hypothetical protein
MVKNDGNDRDPGDDGQFENIIQIFVLRTEENNDKEFSVRIIHIPATM